MGRGSNFPNLYKLAVVIKTLTLYTVCDYYSPDGATIVYIYRAFEHNISHPQTNGKKRRKIFSMIFNDS